MNELMRLQHRLSPQATSPVQDGAARHPRTQILILAHCAFLELPWMNSFALFSLFLIDFPSFKNINLQYVAKVPSEQWQETALCMLSLHFIDYWRARNKAEEGSCLSQRGNGLRCPWLVYTHSWSCRTHRSERLLFCSRLIRVTCLCRRTPPFMLKGKQILLRRVYRHAVISFQD